MSEKNTEGKKQEEQAPSKPILLHILEEIQSKAEVGASINEIIQSFAQFFRNLTHKRFVGEDQETKEYEEYLKKQGKTSVSTLDEMSQVLEDYNLFLVFWFAWGQEIKKKEKTDLGVMFRVLETEIVFATQEVIKKIYLKISDEGWNFDKLAELGKKEYYNDPFKLESIGIVLEKLGSLDRSLSRQGKSFCARAQALLVKDELKKETQEEVKTLIEESSKSFSDKASKETDDKLKKFDGRIQGVETRFIQIIGIFAAIIAFIVTMVPTAARLGGASIPVALAGLAIVTGGIIVLLAMIFGKDERRKSLSKGLTGIIIAFILWLTLTVVLAFVEPNVLAPPERVDTLYIDTVGTTPPPTPSIEEGE